jgi:hypothetical protein
MALKNLFRTRIQIGNYSPLRPFMSECSRCQATFNVLWPVEVLSIPTHRNLSLECPYCKKVFLSFAGMLVEGEDLQLRAGQASVS